MGAEPPPVGIPLDGLDPVAASLLERRILVVSGELEHERASALAAALLTLDATGDDHVELRLHACRGSLDAALAIVDVVDVMGVAVHAVALGRIEGGPVGLLAAAADRRIAPHATLLLREPDVAVTGVARDVERQVAAHAARRAQFLEVLARATRRPFAELDAEWDRGAVVEAADAVALGYADGVLAVGERPTPP